MSAYVFPARYDGVCPLCDRNFAAGAPIKWDDGDYVHAVCPDPLKSTQGQCPKCFTELPITGVCEACDD